MATSFCITFFQFTIYRAAASGDPLDWIYMGIGGSLGIASSMFIHNKLRRRNE